MFSRSLQFLSLYRSNFCNQINLWFRLIRKLSRDIVRVFKAYIRELTLFVTYIEEFSYFWSPFIFPLFPRIQLAKNLINLLERSILYFGPFFMCFALLDMLNVILVRFVAHLTIGVIFVGYWLQQRRIVI